MSERIGETETKAGHPPVPADRLSLLWRRVKEHRIAQWTVGYVALAYAIQHAVILTSESFEWPNIVARVSMLLLALGLPLAMTLAWYHGASANRRISGAELSILATLLAGVSILFYVFVKPAGEGAEQSSARQASLVSSASQPGQTANGISLAVLPFVNLSGDASQEFFSDGITEEITSALAKVSDLRVVARASAFQFKGEKKDMRAVGQALSARYLIDGSVRRAGTRVRISAQLIEASNGLQVWTENYDRELTDIFATQEDIAKAIAVSLRVPLGIRPGENLVNNRSIDSESYQEFLRAKALVRARGITSLTDAAAVLDQVVARDPSYSPAWALLALTYDLTPIYDPALLGDAGPEARRVVDRSLPKAEAAAQRAIQLDAKNADAYVALGMANERRGKVLQAEELYLNALKLDENNPDALHRYSDLLADAGRLKDALAVRQKLQAVEPFVPVFNAQTAEFYWLNGQNDAAIAMLRDLPPSAPNRTAFLAMIYGSMGRYRDAADTLAETPTGMYLPGVAESAARLMRTAPAKTASPAALPVLGYLGYVYLYIGASDRVLDHYQATIDAGYLGGGLTASIWHPSSVAIRKSKRFKAFVRKAGFVEYWRAKGWPPQCHPITGDDFVCE